MISIIFIEYLFVATSVVSTISILFMINNMANIATNNFIKLKQEKKSLEEIQKKNSSDKKNLKEMSIFDDPKMEILIKENHRLCVRCDILEEELTKLRVIQNEQNYLHPII